MTEPDFELVAALRRKVRTHKPCRGYGKVLDDKGELVDCDCRAEAEYQYRLARSGIPPKFRKMGFKDYVYKEGDAFRQVQAYLTEADKHRQDGTGLYLYGPSYTGKSLLACSLLMELMKRGYDGKYISFDGLLDSKDRGVMDSVDQQWDFLVLDKVGDVLNRLNNFREGTLSGDRIHGAVEMLSTLVSRRINAGRPIIIPNTESVLKVNEKFASLACALLGSFICVACEDKGFRQRRIEQMMGPEQ